MAKLVDELRERDAQLADLIQPLCEDMAEKYFADRYPGFDLEDPDWSAMGGQAEEIALFLAIVKERVGDASASP